MAVATILKPLHPAPAARELLQSKLRKSSRMRSSSTWLQGGFTTASPYLQFCSCKRRAALSRSIVATVRSTENDAETRDVQFLALDNADNLPWTVESVGGTRTETKSFLERSLAKLQLSVVLIALAMAIFVKVAAARFSGSPFDGWKKNLVWPLSSLIIQAYCSDQGMSAAEFPEAEDHKTINGKFFKDSQQNGREDCSGKLHRGGMKRYGVALAAEMDGSDDEARREYEEWKATPYAITVPLRLVGLRGSVPPVWLKDFASSQGKRVKVVAEFQGNLQTIFTGLSGALASQQKLAPKSVLAADLITVGDSWLGMAVSQGLVTPIENVEKHDWFHRLGTQWQTFLRRNKAGEVDPNGKVYAVPYRWGSVVIAYNRKKFKQHGISAIEDWDDLWRPELAGKIAMVSSPRDVIGAVLKSLGASYNVKDFETDVPGGRHAVQEKFQKLQQQVRVFDSIQYLKTLGAGEVWVAVGWSGDVIPFAKRSSNISVITPRSGTSLWADLWAIPATPKSSTNVGGRIRGPSPLVHQWLDFCLQPARANSFRGDVFVGASPLALAGQSASENSTVEAVNDSDRSLSETNGIVVGTAEEKLPSVSRDSLPPSHDPLRRDEFLEPLSPTASEDFKWLLSTSSGVPKFQLQSLVEKIRNFFASGVVVGS